MSRKLLKLTVLGVATLAFMGTAHAKIETGSTVSNITVVDSDGNTHNLTDFAGQKVVLEWTNHQCPYVVKHYNPAYEGGNMQNLQQAAVEGGVVWLSIISSAPGKQGYVSGAQANQLSADRGAAPSAVILDASGEAGQMFSAKTTPHMYVIDEAQTLVYQGAIDDIRSTNVDDIANATNYVTAALNAMDAGTPVAETDTKPYGCNVKY